jgi:hypothetical protein
MLRRFVSAATVASVALMIAAVVVSLLPGISRERIAVLLWIWLCVPAVWGTWALIAPRSWVPARLPSWGAILGVFAGVMAAFLIDIPFRVLGMTLSFRQRFAAILPLVVVYYVLWMVVRAVLVKVTGPEATAKPRSDSARVA